MSNVVFTPPKGLTYPVKKTPRFSTLIQSPASGRGELRVPLYNYPLFDFDLQFSYLPGAEQIVSSDAEYIMGLFGQMQGCYDTFLFSDPNDNTATNQLFATGDGTTTVFQLIEAIGNMTCIVQNLNGSATIKDNGTTVTPTVSSTGLVTFSVAPLAGHSLTWSGQYYYRLRFVEDSLADLEEILYQIWDLGSMKLQTVIL